jgi:hypothetical protein
MGIPAAIRGPSDTRLAPEIPFYLNLYLNSLFQKIHVISFIL